LTFLSILELDPGAPAFDSWIVDTRFNLAGVDLRHVFYLADTMDGSYSQLTVAAEIGGLAMRNTVQFAGCGIDLESNHLQVTWSSSACDARFSGTFRTSCEHGFDGFTLALLDLPIDVGLLPPLELDINWRYAVDEKSVDIGVSCDDLFIDCLRFFCDVADEEQNTGALEIDGFLGYGIEMQCTLPSAIAFRYAASLSGDKNVLITGDSDYFAVASLSGPMDACCDVSSVWRIQVLFEHGAPSLFDIGLIRASADIILSKRFLFSSDLSYDLSGGGFEWVIGFDVDW